MHPSPSALRKQPVDNHPTRTLGVTNALRTAPYCLFHIVRDDGDGGNEMILLVCNKGIKRAPNDIIGVQ